jgi:thiosulfate/3-mercaptopyruvate sulfurtransferase
MNRLKRISAVLVGMMLVIGAATAAQMLPVEPETIGPEELVKVLKGPKKKQPVILYVGFRLLYVQAHIPGSEFIGATSEAAGVERLRQRVAKLPRNQFIVLYCGCCPWSHCPNVKPAARELAVMGFRNVKVVYMASNFGADWADKGYPVEKGE